MTLIEYIRQSYQRPNRRILEALGANERLIEYLMDTPENANWNVIDSFKDDDDKNNLVGSAIVGIAIL